MTRDAVLKELAAFFMEEFNNNPSSVKDWVAQGDYDCNLFVKAVINILEEK